MPPARAEKIVDGLLAFVDRSPTPYHAVSEAVGMLEEAGFGKLDEGETWRLPPGTRAYVVRGGSSLCAFVVGDRSPAEAGFQLIGAHTDSPNLRIKPQPDVRAHGYEQLAVEVYGGVLLHTWLDRDLSIAGRVVLDEGGKAVAARTALVDFRRALVRIPSLAIHLNRTVNTDGLKLNAQSHLAPILALEGDPRGARGLRSVLADELSKSSSKVTAEQILGWDLCLYDVQPSARGGLNSEFLLAPRLDNLASCYAALQALAQACGSRPDTRAIVLYDHEEVGSQSAQGAGSSFLRDVLTRVCAACDAASHDSLPRAIARSLMISADMAHAIHPNYADRHEPGHQPRLGGGPVLKTNTAQSYATDAESGGRFRKLCRAAKVDLQEFVTRSDLACGSTIGPITAARMGLRTVDVGNPLLSMHSIREMASVADVGAIQRVLDTFLRAD